MVGGHHVVAQPLAELVGEPLGQPPGVDEHERGAVLAHQLGDAVDHVAHLLGRRHGLELALGQLEGQVERRWCPVSTMAHGAGAPAPHSRRGDVLDGPLGGRQADALGPLAAGVLEPLERERQVRAPLVAGHGVDLVDDDRLDRAEHGPAPGGGDQEVERLGRGDHEVGRAPHHGGPLAGGGVAGAHADPQVEARPSRARRHLGDLAQGRSRFSAMSTASAFSGET